MLAPILVVCAVAFTPLSYLSLPTSGLSFRWFRALGANRQFVGAFETSLWLGCVSATCAVAISVPAALAIVRYVFAGKQILLALFQAPFMVPTVVLGIAFLRFFSEIGLGGSFVALIIGHVVVVMPFALRIMISALSGLDRAAERAAASLGAGALTIFRRIILPAILPGVVSGWVLAFITSFDELTMTTFVAAPETTTLPLRLFLYIQDNIDPLIAAASASLIGMTVLLLIVLDRLYGLDRLLVGEGRR
ncbi:MAG TPA: ABC transporter permease [Rhizomicrobium sp.]|nr:ABC transporter permease [Rhizomicrobium sp.]